MATFKHQEEHILTATPVNISLPVTDPYSLYVVTSATSIVIAGTTNFTSLGTLAEGVDYEFKYTATVTSGSVTFMGVALPTHLLAKSVRIHAHYTGTAWEVEFTPDATETAIVTNANLVTNPGTHIVTRASVAGFTTINTAGAQLLSSAVIPADTLTGAGALEGYRITAMGEFTGVASKVIEIRGTTGANVHVLFINSTYVDQNGVFKLDVMFTATNPATSTFQSEAMLVASGQYGEGYAQSAATWDYTVSQTMVFMQQKQLQQEDLLNYIH